MTTSDDNVLKVTFRFLIFNFLRHEQNNIVTGKFWCSYAADKISVPIRRLNFLYYIMIQMASSVLLHHSTGIALFINWMYTMRLTMATRTKTWLSGCVLLHFHHSVSCTALLTTRRRPLLVLLLLLLTVRRRRRMLLAESCLQTVCLLATIRSLLAMVLFTFFIFSVRYMIRPSVHLSQTSVFQAKPKDSSFLTPEIITNLVTHLVWPHR